MKKPSLAKKAMPSRLPTDVDLQVGQNIRVFRLARHLTLSDLADRLEISQQQLQKYESGKSRISASMILGIAKAMNLKIEDIFTGTEGPSSPKQSAAEKARRECHMWIERSDSTEELRLMARLLKAVSSS